QDFALIVVTNHEGERDSGSAKRNRIILAQLGCLPCQSNRLGKFSLAIRSPSAPLSQNIGPRCHPISGSETRIKLDSPAEIRQCIFATLFSPLMNTSQAAQIVIISVQILCRLAFGPLDLGLLHFGEIAPITLVVT